MENKKFKIDAPSKDTMLFVLNDIYGLNVKDNYTKKKLLDIADDIYSDIENVILLLDILPYESYKLLEQIYEAYSNNNDYEDLLNNDHYLCDIMLYSVQTEVKTTNSKYVFSKNLLDNLYILFSEENKRRALKNDTAEKIVRGLLFTYGVMKDTYFYSFINSYLKANYDAEDINRFLHIRLSLNEFVEYFSVNWQNINEIENYVSYMPYSEELGRVAESQKQLKYNYNLFDLDYILEKSMDEIPEVDLRFLECLKENLPSLTDKDCEKLYAKAMLGDDNLDFLKNHFKLVGEDVANDLIDEICEWHNNLRIYTLCGYTPNTLEEETIN